jgi:hypothetical protein
LRIKDKEGNKLVWYRNKNLHPITSDVYPDSIKPYLNWVYTYAKTRKVEKVAGVENNLKWKLSILLRLE